MKLVWKQGLRGIYMEKQSQDYIDGRLRPETFLHSIDLPPEHANLSLAELSKLYTFTIRSHDAKTIRT